MTQTEKVMQYMRKNGGITSAEAMNELGIMRLASRISDLRSMGVEIRSELIKGKNRFGESTHYSRYYIAE